MAGASSSGRLPPHPRTREHGGNLRGQTLHESQDTRLRSRILLGIVEIDDAWGILVFGLAMALLAAERYPEEGPPIMAAVVVSTIVFELIGPLLVRRALR